MSRESPIPPAIASALHAWFSSNSGTASLLLVLGMLLLVSLAVFIWAAFFRKPPRHRHLHHHHWKHPKPAPTNDAGDDHHRPGLRFWRRHRQRHKKRLPNPTLAETGGLPPPRTGQSEPPPTL